MRRRSRFRKRLRRGKRFQKRIFRRYFSAKRKFKRSLKYRRKNKLRIGRFPTGDQIPDVARTKMIFTMPFSIAGDGIQAGFKQQYQLNKLNDPAYNGTICETNTMQPYNYDLMAAMYGAYTVLASAIKMRFYAYDTNSANDTPNAYCSIFPRETTFQTQAQLTALESYGEIKAIPRASLMYFQPELAGGGRGRQYKIRNYASVKKLSGHKSPLDNNIVYISSSADPIDNYSWFITFSSTNQTTAWPTTLKIKGFITIKYYVQWYIKNFLPQSTTNTTSITSGGNQTNTIPA